MLNCTQSHLGEDAGLEWVTLTAKDYHCCVHRLRDFGLAGGVIYNALIARAALKSHVNHLITANSCDPSVPGSACHPVIKNCLAQDESKDGQNVSDQDQGDSVDESALDPASDESVQQDAPAVADEESETTSAESATDETLIQP